jgi:hypothetical protein
MNVERFKASDLKPLFKRRGILSMPELKGALGTDVDMTVFRKLKELSYLTSYSHGGRFYTIEEVARFDERGLWCRRGVRFSVHGTLLATLEALVGESAVAVPAADLRDQLQVEVKETLLRLVKRGRVRREKVGRRYLYCSIDPGVRRRQLARRATEMELSTKIDEASGGASDEVKAALVLFVSLLDEKQRRLYAGLEALRVGPGGDHRIAELLGMHPQTVAKGRSELLERDVVPDRVRRSGGGRKPVEKKRQS